MEFTLLYTNKSYFPTTQMNKQIYLPSIQECMMQDVRQILGQLLRFKPFGHQDLGVIPPKGKT